MSWNRESKMNGALVLLAVMAAWELASRAEMLNPLFFPPMSTILKHFWSSFLPERLPRRS